MTTAAAAVQSPVRPRFLRRCGAIFAGLLFIFIVSTAADAVMHALGVFPPLGSAPMSGPLFLLAFSYRLVFNLTGCWLTARLAPVRPMQHALILGGIGLAFSIVGAIAMWEAGPAWYSLGVAASALPCAYLGGRLGSRS